MLEVKHIMVGEQDKEAETLAEERQILEI